MEPAITDGDGASPATGARPRESASRRLLHRWFIEYNPLYLVSALLVLGGLMLISRGQADQASMSPEVGSIPVIAEIYAAVLIAGAALLTRLGLRRPAVMLALLTALYQGDLTLFTERSVYLGSVGALAAFAWLAVFVIKLYALGWAVRLRVSRSAMAVAAWGALGIAVLPRALSQLDPARSSALVALWVFSLFAAGLWTSRAVTSAVELDAWGRTVLARAVRAAWAMWAALALMHVIFWCVAYQISALVLLPVALLLATRWMRREASVWAAATGTLLLAGWTMPASLSSVALMAAVALSLRALRKPVWTPDVVEELRSTEPYRVPRTGEPPLRPRASLTFTRAERDSMIRLLIGSFSSLYLAAWTARWSGGALPQHVIALDLLLAVAAAVVVWRERARAALAPAAVAYLHLAVQTRYLTAPTSPAQWGGAAVGLGFSLLVLSLLASWRWRPSALSASEEPHDRARPAAS